MRNELLDAARLMRQVRVKLYTAAQQAEDAAYEVPDHVATALELAGSLRELAVLADHLRARCAKESKHTANYLDVKREKAKRDG